MEMGPYLYPMVKKGKIFEFFNYFPLIAWEFTIHALIYINMVSNESL